MVEVKKENELQDGTNAIQMLCFQCQEAIGGTGCTSNGVCGKKAGVANLQDLLIFVLKGISFWTHEGLSVGVYNKEISHYITKMLFSTVTNVNYDEDSLLDLIKEGLNYKNIAKNDFITHNKESIDKTPEAADWEDDISQSNIDNLKKKGLEVSPNSYDNVDLRALYELIIYGLKGIAAYADHALVLGHEDEEIWKFIEEVLAKFNNKSLEPGELLEITDKTGAIAVKVLALLDKANTETFGQQEITEVNIGVGNNPGILISGHDLLDLKELLEQSAGKGVDIYTHGEMLTANAYPELKKHPHLVGNYGNAWWLQKSEFESFNGPILLTTNCLVPPKDSYKERLFVTGNVKFPGANKIEDREVGKQKDFSKIIEIALKSQPPEKLEDGKLTIGFAANSVLSVADKVVEAIKSGAIKRFIVMAGCDGRQKSRNYFKEVAEKLPKDTIILTAGCAKYKYNKLDLGDIGGIPRVLDAGQCNDCYSLVVIALKLVEVFGLESVNDLPLSMDIAWYEQKAVTVLLALLHLGVKGIRLGPTLPAYLTPNIVKALVDTFDIKPISNPDDDIKNMLIGK